jgi:hypothetical protein
VSSTADSGPNSLRDAITQLNGSSSGPNAITFSFSGLQTINLTSALPAITQPVTIDGGNIAELNGAGVSGAANGMVASVPGITIQNLAIDGFGGAGIVLAGGIDSVQGNLIGVDPSHSLPITGNGTGILVTSSGNLIGGPTPAVANVVSGNNADAIDVFTGDSNTIQGNLIGVDPTGTRPNSNGAGIELESVNGPVSGTQVIGNTISANFGQGINIDGSSNNTFQGNFIGTNSSGLDPIGNLYNHGDGIRFTLGSTGNLVGGTGAGANVIAGSSGAGVVLDTDPGTSNTIQGNLIGIDASNQPDGNGGAGVWVMTGGAVISDNVICANFGWGVELQTDGAVVTGNYIGTDAAGDNLGNTESGIYITGNNNLVGGAASGQGNVIAFNGTSGPDGAGVYIPSVDVISGNPLGPVTGNAIRGNSIYSNVNLGIALGTDQLVNTTFYQTGPNNFQAFPQIATAMLSGTTLTVTGTMPGAAGTAYVLDFFANSSAGPSNPAGYGQGQFYVGSATVMGGANFSVNFNNFTSAWTLVSATATDPSGNTSEFAADATITAGSTPPPTGSLSGVVFCDDNLDGVLDNGETGLGGAIVTLNDGAGNSTTAITDSDGIYTFSNLTPGNYTISVTTTASGHLAELSHGTVTIPSQPVSQQVAAGPTAAGPNFPEISVGGISGFIYDDANNDGKIDWNEVGVPNAVVTLNGVDLYGHSISVSMTTDDNGQYVFDNLMPGSYSISEQLPGGVTQGKLTLGSAGGSICASSQVHCGSNGSNCSRGYLDCSHSYCDDDHTDCENPCGGGSNPCGSSQQSFCSIPIGGCSDYATGYNFGATGGAISCGSTASIGFWHNCAGQQLLNSLNGSSRSKALGQWLAAEFPNLYGAGAKVNFATMTNAQIASYYNANDFAAGGMKLNAEVLATAFACYVTSSKLAGGNYAACYGFRVTTDGSGYETINIGSNGAAFNVANNTTISILQALDATDDDVVNTMLYGGSVSLDNMAMIVYTAITQGGHVS